MYKDFYWNTPLSFLCETYMIIAVCALLNMKHLKVVNFSFALTDTFAFLGLLAVTALPIWIAIFFYKNKDKLTDNDFTNKYGVIYSTLNPKREGYNVIIFKVAFIVRQFMLAIVLVHADKYLITQFFLILGLNTFIQIVGGLTNPYQLRYDKNMFFFNEFMIMVLTYHFLCCSDFVEDGKTRETIGYSTVGTTSFVIIFDILTVFLLSLCLSYNQLKLNC